MRTTLCFYKEIIYYNTSFKVSLIKSDERISNTKFSLGNGGYDKFDHKNKI